MPIIQEYDYPPSDLFTLLEVWTVHDGRLRHSEDGISHAKEAVDY